MAQGFPVGAMRAMFWRYTSTGIATGQQSSLSAGAGSGAYITKNLLSASANFAETTDLNIRGGDKIVATVSWGNPKLAPFDIELSDVDTTLNDLISGATTNTANSAVVKTSYNPNKGFPMNIGCAIIQRFINSSTGASQFITRFIPKATALIRPGGATYRGESNSVVHISPIASTGTYTGQTYASGSSNLAFGWEDDMGDYYSYITDYPIHLYTFRQDAAATTYTTPYLPVSSTITLNATGNEQIINLAPTALSSFSTTTAVATMAAAGTSGNYAVLTYQTNYVAP